MTLGPIFQPFAEQRPICVAARAILERFFDPARLDPLFEAHAQAGYTRELLFSQTVELMALVVLRQENSVNSAFQHHRAQLGVSHAALYGKLDRLEPGVSQALLRYSYGEGAKLIGALQAREKSWLRGYDVRLLDGNHLAGTEHRLKELRGLTAAALPGKSLVVLHQRTRLIQDLFLTEDGHAQERSLLGALLPLLGRRQLWLADRNFCVLRLLYALSARRACYVIRQHGQLEGEVLGEAVKIGTTATGVVYEQALRLPLPKDAPKGSPEDAQETAPPTAQETVRRIRLELFEPTRDGARTLHLLTNLPAGDADALAVAELYGRRWTIETAFHDLTEWLRCEVSTLAYPQAALFAFSVAALAYNAVRVMTASLIAVHGRQKVEQEVSGYYLGLEIQQTYDGMLVAIPPEHWLFLRTLPLAEFAALLRSLAEQADLERYRKHPRGKKKKPPKKRRTKNQVHVATARLLAVRKRC